MGFEYNTNGLGTMAHYGTVVLDAGAGAAKVEGTRYEIRKKLVLKDLPASITADNCFIPQATLPAGAAVESAKFYITEDATSTGLATLTIGTYYNNAGSIATLDAAGIDATVALTALQKADSVLACDGAHVAGPLLPTTADEYYIAAIYATEVFSAGEGELVVTYVMPVGNV
jgi:hypothetical protein